MLYAQNSDERNAEKILLLFVNFVLKFRKAVQMLEPVYPGGIWNAAFKIGTVPKKSGSVRSLPMINAKHCTAQPTFHL
jgi:hypothetical protein